MKSYVIKLLRYAKGKEGNKAYIKGNAYFRTNKEKIWSKIFVIGIRPDDSYAIFYIMENSDKNLSAACMGEATANRQGKITFTRDYDNKILDGYRIEEKNVIGVILIEKKDRNIEMPIVGFKKAGIEWRPLVEKYITALEYNNDDDYYKSYGRNKEYDNIIDSLRESTRFEKRDKIDKAVEISDLSRYKLEEMLSGINITDENKKILLIRMNTSKHFLYMLGLPDNFSSDKRMEYIENGFKAFLSKSAEETLNSHSEGYWCKYI